MRLVLPNENPDLDGAASAYAYAEYLKHKDEEDENSTGAVFGDVDEKTEEILDELEEDISDATYYLYSADEIILVSASSMENIKTRVNPQKVTEIVDHERISTDDFPNAELTIDEEVNTAAAIIGEKFKKEEEKNAERGEDEEDVTITRESAKLLYEAITNAEETTERDQEIADWLAEKKEE